MFALSDIERITPIGPVQDICQCERIESIFSRNSNSWFRYCGIDLAAFEVDPVAAASGEHPRMIDLRPIVLIRRCRHNDQDGLWVTAILGQLFKVATLRELVAEEVLGWVGSRLRRALELCVQHALLLDRGQRGADELGVNAPIVLSNDLHVAASGGSNTCHVPLLELLHHLRDGLVVHGFDVSLSGLSWPVRAQ